MCYISINAESAKDFSTVQCDSKKIQGYISSKCEKICIYVVNIKREKFETVKFSKPTFGRIRQSTV